MSKQIKTIRDAAFAGTVLLRLSLAAIHKLYLTNDRRR